MPQNKLKYTCNAEHIFEQEDYRLRPFYLRHYFVKLTSIFVPKHVRVHVQVAKWCARKSCRIGLGFVGSDLAFVLHEPATQGQESQG